MSDEDQTPQTPPREEPPTPTPEPPPDNFGEQPAAKGDILPSDLAKRVEEIRRGQ